MKTDKGIHIENGVFLTHEEYDTLVTQNRNQLAEIIYLKQELAQLKRMIFGSKSERFISADTGQLALDLDIKHEPAPEPETESITYTREKPKESDKNGHARLPLPGHLHREEHVIEPETDVTGAKRIGEVVTEILEYVPGKFYVEKYIRPKYALPNEEGIVIGDLPSFPIPRGNAGPGLLTHLIISKFTDHLPFYRQVQQFKRQDVEIAESTINDWFRQTCELLSPLYDKLRQAVQSTGYLQADETPIPVLSKDKPGATHKGYLWVYHAPLEKIVCFDYHKSRGRDGPMAFLKQFQGALQTDGYKLYNVFDKPGDILLLACMAHARRKFDQSLQNDKKRAEYVLQKMQELYMIEQKAREQGLTHDQRLALRKKESLEIIDELEDWLKINTTAVLPKSAIGEAINYTLNLWERLKRYLEDGRYEIDNNLIENSIRPVALGRKNYLFAGSHEGAQRAAMVYSFLGTCKLNKVEPFHWLRDVIRRIPDHKANKIDELLPNNWVNPE